MTDALMPIQQIRYKHYLKKAMVQTLRPAFQNHPDPLLVDTKVTLEMPVTEQAYPAIVIKFYERSFQTAGVGHEESIEVVDGNGFSTGRYQKYRHMLYKGDIEFAVYALSTYDRDLLGDYLHSALLMSDTEPQTNGILDRLYVFDEVSAPGSTSHAVSLNTNTIQGFGEIQNPAPWGAEDKMVYSSTYRMQVMGEVYSRTPSVVDYGKLEKVEIFPYTTGLEPIPTPPWAGPDGQQGTADDVPDPAPWI